VNISKKDAFAAGVTDFEALKRFNRNPYGGNLAAGNEGLKQLPKRLYQCAGGPWAGEKIALSVLDHLDGSAATTLTFRVGQQVGRYKALGYASVEWEAQS
jgi:hypothetical protein